jgi:hypothetical protein
MLMDIIPLDATLVKGSHGRKPDSPAHGPVLLTKNKDLVPADHIEATQVFDIILNHLISGSQIKSQIPAD